MSEPRPGFFKKHVEMFSIIAVIIAVAGLQHMAFDSRFSNLENRLSRLENDFSEIRNEVTQIKTVLIMRGMMPECMAVEKK